MSKLNKFSLSKNSRSRLSSCHPLLILTVEKALASSSVDFGVAEGYRSLERQNQLFSQNLTTIDGISRKGKHNYKPSLAVDIFPYVNNEANYSDIYLCYISGLMFSSFHHALNESRYENFRLRWGGNWDGDGIIATDQTFLDFPHYELVSIK